MNAISKNKAERDAIEKTAMGIAAQAGRLLTTEEAADCLGIGKRTIQELIAERKITYIKFGRNVRFDPADLAAFTERNRVKAIGWKGQAHNDC